MLNGDGSRLNLGYESGIKKGLNLCGICGNEKNREGKSN